MPVRTDSFTPVSIRTDAIGRARTTHRPAPAAGNVVRRHGQIVFEMKGVWRVVRAEVTGRIYNEELFKDVDRGLAIAREEGIRMYIPLVDNWEWFSGFAEWANISGGGDFWTDTTKKGKFKEFQNSLNLGIYP